MATSRLPLSALLLFFFALGSIQAQDDVGYCESPNPFSDGLDCTQILSGTVEEAEEACNQGLGMPGVQGTFTANGRCPLYSAEDRAFGGECERASNDLVVASVLEAIQGSPFADCSMLENVCSTFIQGTWKPAAACDGVPPETVPLDTDKEAEAETGGDSPANSPELPAKVEVLADGFEFTEGPIWIPQTGVDASLPPSTLLFSDMRTSTIYSWSEGQGVQVYSNESMGTNGKAFDGNGNLVGFRSGTRDVVSGSLDDPEAVTVLASGFEGKRFNSPNDGAVNPMDGSIYFSDPIWGILTRPDEKQELDLHGVYRIDAEGNLVSLELASLAMPNGIAVSPEGDFLYVSDTGGLPIHPNPDLASDEPPPTLTAWALEKGRVLEPPVPLWTREDFSDGMCLNEKGLWSTRSGMGPSKYGPKGLVLTDPLNGEEIGHIPIEDPTNVECHTESDGSILYVTTANKVVKVTLL